MHTNNKHHYCIKKTPEPERIKNFQLGDNRSIDKRTFKNMKDQKFMVNLALESQQYKIGFENLKKQYEF